MRGRNEVERDEPMTLDELERRQGWAFFEGVEKRADAVALAKKVRGDLLRLANGWGVAWMKQ